MNFCYCDESGMGSEPIATMVGIVVDSGRMRQTKQDWEELLGLLRGITGRNISELKAASFYAGKGMWRDLEGDFRSSTISAVIEWLAERKHHIVYAAVDKQRFDESQEAGVLLEGVGTPWRMLGFHIALAVQRYSQPEKVPKGHTYMVFDAHDKDHVSFPELILTPPSWSDNYYSRGKRPAFDQIIDVPTFSDSKHVGLLQVADFFAFFFRRYAELKAGYPPGFDGEEQKVAAWVESMATRSVGREHIYPRRNVCEAHQVFIDHAPDCVRSL